MTAKQSGLRGTTVFLSASIPAELAGTPRAQAFFDFLAVFTEGLLAMGGGLVCGGHPTVTPLLHRVAHDLALSEPRITLFQLEKFKPDLDPGQPHPVFDRAVFGDPIWIPPRDLPSEQLAGRLTEMRRQMVQLADAAVFVGGQTTTSLTPRLGLREEFELFQVSGAQKPAYLLGLLDGATGILIAEHEAAADPNRERNTLDDYTRRLLRRTTDPTLAASMVLEDLPHALGALKPSWRP